VSLKRSKKKLAFKAVVSLGFFSILISFVQGNELALMFSRINWFFLLLSLILSPIMIAISCLKWKLILDVGGKRVPFMTLFRIYLIGYFFSNMLPSTVGGDVVRSYYAGKITGDQAYSAIAIFIERFSGIFFLFFLVILTPVFKPSLYHSPYVAVPVAGSLTLIFFTLWIWKVKDPFAFPNIVFKNCLTVLTKCMVMTGRKKPDKLVDKINTHYDTFIRRLEKLHTKLNLAVSTIQKDKKLIVQLVLITVLFYFLTWLNVSFALLAFGVEHQFLDICALVPTIMFVAHIPVTLLGNLGFFESVYVFYMFLIDIPGVESLAMGLLLRMKMLLIGVVGFIVYIAYKNETGDDAKQLDKELS
jgi:uncharacterized protein (TIRG00374 family)